MSVLTLISGFIQFSCHFLHLDFDITYFYISHDKMNTAKTLSCFDNPARTNDPIDVTLVALFSVITNKYFSRFGKIYF